MNVCSAVVKRFRFVWKKIREDSSGGVLVISALLLPIVLLLVGATVNFGLMMLADRKLQASVDAAAIAVAKEMQVINIIDSPNRANELALAVVQEHFRSSRNIIKVEATADNSSGEVNVQARMSVSGFVLASFLSLPNVLQAEATAKVVGKVPVCVIGLDSRSSGAIRLDQDARMTGHNCAVYSNSTSVNGIKSKDNATLSAALICSAGGYVGGKANFAPDPLTDCPVYEDPLANQPSPSVGDCVNEEKIHYDSGNYTLEPGTYCGGIRVSGDARVRLEPGVYVMKDGPLLVEDEAELYGEYTSFYFTGAKAFFRFGADTTVSLGATASGMMAGILFFEDRHNKAGMRHEIFSNNTRNLLGTIYMSRGRIYIGADAPIADESAYTAIITQKLELEAGPHLVLNTNYSRTDVPVPEGVYGGGSRIILTK